MTKENDIKGEFTLIFDLDNNAFQNGNMENEIARILKAIAKMITKNDTKIIKDINGNIIGRWDIYKRIKK